jgi:hypothetical protein
LISSSVRIDVDQLLRDRELERSEGYVAPLTPSRKRKLEDPANLQKAKKHRKIRDLSTMFSKGGPKITLKLGPKPKELEDFPCCLCVSMSNEGLLPVHDPADDLAATPRKAHEHCAIIIPETWVDEYEVDDLLPDGSRRKVRAVFGVDGIVKDRWNLVRSISLFISIVS